MSDLNKFSKKMLEDYIKNYKKAINDANEKIRKLKNEAIANECDNEKFKKIYKSIVRIENDIETYKTSLKTYEHVLKKKIKEYNVNNINKQKVIDKLKGIKFISYFDNFFILDGNKIFYKDIINVESNYEMVKITLKNVEIKILK